jgi:hypothetical protein
MRTSFHSQINISKIWLTKITRTPHQKHTHTLKRDTQFWFKNGQYHVLKISEVMKNFCIQVYTAYQNQSKT